MQNIYLSPTKEKTFFYRKNGEFYLGSYDICDPNDSTRENIFIYVTANETAKLNQWCFEWKDEEMTMTKIVEDRFADYPNNKIVFTNDPRLWEDGVQPVTSNLLEWMVEYPNTQSVEVLSELKAYDKHGFCVSHVSLIHDYTKVLYYLGKPNIPKSFATIEEAAIDFIENTMKYSFKSMDTKTLANRMLKCVMYGAELKETMS